MGMVSTLGFRTWLAPLKKSVSQGLLILLLMSGSGVFGETAPAVDQAIPAQSSVQLQSGDERMAQTLKLRFREDFAKVLVDARTYLGQQGKCKCRHKKQAVVLDLDETLLDNRAYFVIHKKYDPTLWDQWLAEAEAPGIPEAVDFYNWLRAQGYKTYFISGRKEKYRQATIDNLKRVGVSEFDGLYLKPDQFSGASASNFKVAARQEIESKGYKVLLILGDQESDLTGGYGTGFKLPNPIYTVP